MGGDEFAEILSCGVKVSSRDIKFQSNECCWVVAMMIVVNMSLMTVLKRVRQMQSRLMLGEE